MKVVGVPSTRKVTDPVLVDELLLKVETVGADAADTKPKDATWVAGGTPPGAP